MLQLIAKNIIQIYGCDFQKKVYNIYDDYKSLQDGGCFRIHLQNKHKNIP